MRLQVPAPTAGKPWTESTVYRIQCMTAAIFNRQNLITSDVSRGPDPRHYFRVVPAYRCEHSLKLRQRVADEVRTQRLEAEGMTRSDAQAVMEARQITE